MSSKNYLSIYAKSFNWAGFFLPKKTYKNCSYLYDFCRVVDNIADDEGEIEIKKVKFQKFVSDFKQKNFEDPVIQNMWNIINEFNIYMTMTQGPRIMAHGTGLTERQSYLEKFFKKLYLMRILLFFRDNISSTNPNTGVRQRHLKLICRRYIIDRKIYSNR